MDNFYNCDSYIWYSFTKRSVYGDGWMVGIRFPAPKRSLRFPFCTESKPTLEPTRSPIQLVIGAVFPRDIAEEA